MLSIDFIYGLWKKYKINQFQEKCHLTNDKTRHRLLVSLKFLLYLQLLPFFEQSC